jgi:DNA-binding transcriptional regulator GbsR (MarR family)
MNIKIELNVKAPELVSAIEKLTTVIPTKSLETDSKESKNDLKEDTTDNKSKIQSTVVVTLEEVRTKLATLAQSGKQEKVKRLIKKYGGSKLSEIDPVYYEKLLKDAEEIQ